MNNKRLREIRNAAEAARRDYDLAHSTDECFEDVEELLQYVQALREQIDVLHGYVNGKPVEITTESTAIPYRLSDKFKAKGTVNGY